MTYDQIVQELAGWVLYGIPSGVFLAVVTFAFPRRRDVA